MSTNTRMQVYAALGRSLEFMNLSSQQREAVERTIDRAHAHPGRQTETLPGGDEAYAYQVTGGIHWGFNGGKHGFCIACGKVAL
jgi:hypothetical protein